jgi:hypothetical protein
MFLFGTITELLPPNAGFVHQTALGDGENGHALVVPAHSFSVVLTAADTGRATRRRGADRSPGGDRYRRSLGAEFEVATGKFIESTLVFEKDNLTVPLSPVLLTVYTTPARCNVVARLG